MSSQTHVAATPPSPQGASDAPVAWRRQTEWTILRNGRRGRRSQYHCHATRRRFYASSRPRKRSADLRSSVLQRSTHPEPGRRPALQFRGAGSSVSLWTPFVPISGDERRSAVKRLPPHQPASQVAEDCLKGSSPSRASESRGPSETRPIQSQIVCENNTLTHPALERPRSLPRWKCD